MVFYSSVNFDACIGEWVSTKSKTLSHYHLPILNAVKKYLDDVPSISVTSWYYNYKGKKRPIVG